MENKARLCPESPPACGCARSRAKAAAQVSAAFGERLRTFAPSTAATADGIRSGSGVASRHIAVAMSSTSQLPRPPTAVRASRARACVGCGCAQVHVHARTKHADACSRA